MKKPNHETIYLIPGSYDGEHCYVWSDDPAPGAEDNPADAVEYVRADLYLLTSELLANRIVELTKERDALKAQVEQLQTKNAAILQEAKIHASELDTQKSIIAELCGLLSLRVHDYHCVSKVKEALAARDAEVATKAVEQFANVVFDESLKKRKGLLPVLSLAKEFNEAQRTGKLPPLLPHVG